MTPGAAPPAIAAVIARRVAWTIVVVWFVVTATFAMLAAIPEDPAKALAGPRATPAELERVRARYGLDDGALAQYGRWLARVARGDLGESYRTKRAVTAILAERVWPTAQLALAALALQLAIGLPLGVVAAARRGRWPDRATGVVALLAQSAPPFVVGTALMYVVAYRWDLLPIGGYGDGGLDRVRHLVLPALTLAALGIATYARVVRVELGAALGADHVRTARAKGLPERAVVWRHALRPALGPVVTLAGLDLGVLLGGAVVTEHLFAWPGLGREVLRATLEVDVPVIAGVVLIAAVAVAVANLIADLVLLRIDPRVRR